MINLFEKFKGFIIDLDGVIYLDKKIIPHSKKFIKYLIKAKKKYIFLTNDSTLSRLTMSTEGDEKVVEQITKQLDKLIDVVMVTNLSESEFVERELMLIKFTKELIAHTK